MRFSIILLFAVLFFYSYSFATECSGYSEENLTIRVLDQLYRPVEGASVQVTFDRGASFGEKYFTTQPKQTDALGNVYFTILNQGTQTRKIDCNIYITAWFGPSYAKKTIEALSHPSINDVVLPVYRVTFFVHDQQKRPLKNASIFFLNETKQTDEFGRAFFYSQNWTSEYYVSYMGGKEAEYVEVKGDTEREVVIPVYQINVSAMDEYGNPLQASVQYLNQSFQISDSPATFSVYQYLVELTVKYENIEKTITMQPANTLSKVVYFDLHPPTISEPQQNISNGRVRMSFKIIDEGQYASGVDLSSIQVFYKILPDGKEQKLTAYSLGGSNYGVDFPPIKEGTLVEFVVRAKDNDGNIAYRQGRFVIAQAQEANTTANTTTQQPESKSEDYTFFYAAGVIIFIILAVYMLRMWLKNRPSG
jgi:hypothetical protein